MYIRGALILDEANPIRDSAQYQLNLILGRIWLVH